MGIIKKLTLRNLQLKRKRTIVTIIGIILSGAMIMGVGSIAASFQDFFLRSAIQSDGNYHASLYDVAVDKVETIAQDQAVAAVMLSRTKGFVPFTAGTEGHKPYLMLRQYDEAAFAHFPLTLLEGRLPANGQELLIPETVQQLGNYQPGDTITLSVGQRYLDGEPLAADRDYQAEEEWRRERTESYTITGIVADPRFGRGLPGYAVFTALDAAALQEAEKVNVSLLSTNVRQIFAQVPALAEKAGVQNYSYNRELLRWSGVSDNRDVTNFLNSITLIIIVLIVVGSVAVIYNAFAISVNDRKKQYGMLASVGATPRQLKGSVFYEALLLGAVGIPLGIAAGLGGIGVTLQVVNRILLGSVLTEELAFRLVISPQAILVTVVFEALTILLSAWLPAKRAAQISPIEAIRLTDELQIKGKDVRTGKLTGKLLGIEGELALKNLKRNRKQYRATVFSLVISIVLFVTFSSFMQYGFVSRDLYYGEIPYNVVVYNFNEEGEVQDSFYRQVLALPEVERAAVVRTLYSRTELASGQLGKFVHKQLLPQGFFPPTPEGLYRLPVEITAVGEEEFAAYLTELGLAAADYTDRQQLKAVLVNKNVMEGKITYQPLQVTAGTVLTLSEQSVEAEQAVSFALQIGAVSDKVPLGVSFADSGLKLIVSEQVMAALSEGLSAASQQELRRASLHLSSHDSSALVEKIKLLQAAVGADFDVHDLTQMQAELKRTTTVMGIFLYGFVALITLIGVTNVFNTISTNVTLRRREFAMLQSVGLTPQGLQKIIRFESLFYGLKALLYGLPLSIFISVWMFNAFSQLFTFTFVLPWREIIICSAAVFLVTFLTMAQASAKFKQQNIVTALGAGFF